MDDEKEKKRKKQHKRMGKILGNVWELDDETNYFQERPVEYQKENNDELVLCLSDIGQKIDSKSYRLGRHGWEDFAKDLGGVYNFHTRIRKSKATQLAKKHLEVVCDLLGPIEKTLVDFAKTHIPIDPNDDEAVTKKTTKNQALPEQDKPVNNKKRKVSESNNVSANKGKQNDNTATTATKKAKHGNKNSELAEREERAIEQLCEFIEELGGNRSLVAGYRSRVTKKKATNNSNSRKYDIVYYNESDRRFRSMQEVGRFLKLVKGGSAIRSAGVVRSRSKAFGKVTSKEIDNEKKRIRKELERLRKAHSRVLKTLDDIATNRSDVSYPIDDRLLLEEEEEVNGSIQSSTSNGDLKKITQDEDNNPSIKQGHSLKITRETCAGACVADLDGFSGIPKDCIPDILMTWDFLCTFERALSLSPIALDDFASALIYVPPDGQTGDDVLAPPVYIAEAHLSLLKLLLQDRSSDDWWWSTLESDEVAQKQEAEFDEADDSGKDNDGKPLIKINIALVLETTEDPVATRTWMRALEHVGKDDRNDGKALKSAIRTALKVVYNKWVAAYLRKTLDVYKSQGLKQAKRAVQWLVDTVLEARPDLGSETTVHKETIAKARNKVIEATKKQMDLLSDSIPEVTEDDAPSDFDYEDDSDDDSEDDDSVKSVTKTTTDIQDGSEKPASTIPPKPLPSIVDLLLPPAKPKHNSEFVDSFTWSHVVGATVARYLHRKKRVLNEMDDAVRVSHFLPPLTVSERREREKVAYSRVLSECCGSSEPPSPLEKSVAHLCSGGNYLDLSSVERLCILRLLIEAAYDTGRVFEVVSGNYKQRANATKSLELEQRRAKKEAKEKSAAEEAAAREQLAAEAREKFIDEKREEIRALNAKSKEFSDDVIESFTEEDIIEFDEDIKADYEALPGPESFNKAEVTRMIRKMQEQAAFDTDALRVLTLSELVQREHVELEEMEGQLAGFGGGDSALLESADRETRRSIERLQRDIERAKAQADKLPALREKAMEQLAEALENGTTKVLRNAFTAAKKAKLTGVDDETGGVWAVDLMRDVALELENAKQNKRLLDAQRDLVAKLNKCFIRTEPVGRDRFGNRFWGFDSDEAGHTWRETEFIVKDSENGSTDASVSGFVNLKHHAEDITVGSKDMEQDFLVGNKHDNEDSFALFSRREYHSSGLFPSLAKHSWGCYATEDSLKSVMKLLDSRGIREQHLKSRLKESIEQAAGLNDRHETGDANVEEEEEEQGHDQENEPKDTYKANGDEAVFVVAKYAFESKDEATQSVCDSRTTGIDAPVRVRKVISQSKHAETARYENGVITGWNTSFEVVENRANEDDEEEEFEDSKPVSKKQEVPVWRVRTDHGRIAWLTGDEVIRSMVRFKKWEQGHGYFEQDAAFFAYRNNHGRFCGKAADAPYSSSPALFARLMMKREGELYPKLKVRSYDNSWGGQSGARALWTNSMKDYAYDFPTVRQGLLTLENAFFELTGKFSEYKNVDDDESLDGNELLNDTTSRLEIELESIEKGLPGLWNSPASRAVYIAIVNGSSTTGLLALALDLLVRNTMKFLQTHKLINARSSRSTGIETVTYEETNTRPLRSTRRMNTWQQQQLNDDDDDMDNDDDNSDEDWR